MSTPTVNPAVAATWPKNSYRIEVGHASVNVWHAIEHVEFETPELACAHIEEQRREGYYVNTDLRVVAIPIYAIYSK